MNHPRLQLIETLQQLPAPWIENPQPIISDYLHSTHQKLIVLDDDPTGSQLVHSVPILTEWSVESLVRELNGEAQAIYLLTNSRSLPPAQADQLSAHIAHNINQAVAQTTAKVVIVSRGDSTLRGHFPNEVQALADHMSIQFDAWIVLPALPEAGRFTINDIHYVAQGDWLIPAGETPYAQDPDFGYHSSNLREWVVERSQGKIPFERVHSISLEDLRSGGPEQVRQRLLALEKGAVCIVNAASRRDVDVFVLGLLKAEEAGKNYLFRSGPTFVMARIGLAPYPLLKTSDLSLPEESGGLIIVGSYVPNTSGQINRLLEGSDIDRLEVSVEKLLALETQQAEIARVAALANQNIAAGRDTVIYTSRKLAVAADADGSLEVGKIVSNSLIRILHAIPTRPRYILAKGGITSHNVATLGLGIRRAVVLGQIMAGISVWQAGPESLFPGICYLIFPGNVGSPDTLLNVVNKLKLPKKV